ncbi:hypothetical protein BCR37DRAFT_70229 [Protomyces lactucae-debilis]|uniref:Uncharacterized protein n=1 Tax=Protomyces lactucae-debilis TaxID=2754530 RepID=A0A1Y2FAJ1_PROLT|nr:uncharacterized protein BCR37DRAFT_70229 [Protomyces lactucae-debilis]ORY80464.1 hypothetical protein BCR37DRAFT_70229 [Protomyces lactucae-debilis]
MTQLRFQITARVKVVAGTFRDFPSDRSFARPPHAETFALRLYNVISMRASAAESSNYSCIPTHIVNKSFQSIASQDEISYRSRKHISMSQRHHVSNLEPMSACKGAQTSLDAIARTDMSSIDLLGNLTHGANPQSRSLSMQGTSFDGLWRIYDTPMRALTRPARRTQPLLSKSPFAV